MGKKRTLETAETRWRKGRVETGAMRNKPSRTENTTSWANVFPRKNCRRVLRGTGAIIPRKGWQSPRASAPPIIMKRNPSDKNEEQPTTLGSLATFNFEIQILKSEILNWCIAKFSQFPMEYCISTDPMPLKIQGRFIWYTCTCTV